MRWLHTISHESISVTKHIKIIWPAVWKLFHPLKIKKSTLCVYSTVAVCVYCPIPSWLGHISPCERREEMWCCKHIPGILSPPPCSCWAYCEGFNAGGIYGGGLGSHSLCAGRATAKNDSCSSWSWDIALWKVSTWQAINQLLIGWSAVIWIFFYCIMKNMNMWAFYHSFW